MHEHSFIEAIIREVPDKERVKSIVIEVGDLANITSSHLREHLIEHTGWDVIVSDRSSEVECECGYLGSANVRQRLHDLVVFDCPKCGRVPKVVSGDKIKIVKVVYD